MKRGTYLQAKEENKQTVHQGMIALVVFVVIFMAVVFAVAEHAGSDGGFFSLSPGGSDAYHVAQSLVKPATLNAGEASFPSGDYRCAKKRDSIFVVTSYYTTRDIDGEVVKTDFRATLRYNGGDKSQPRNWTLVRLVDF